MKFRCVLCVLCLLLLLGNYRRSTAQSVLPGINAAVDSGRVKLRWICQYDGVKSITVKRSVDSNYNFATIGNVKIVAKGEQYFIDYAPATGVGYYKLSIVFNSGLSWSSNTCKVAVDKSKLLQHTTTTVGGPPTSDGNRSEITSDGIVNMLPAHYSFRVSYPDLDMNDASFIIPKFVATHKVFGHVVIKVPVMDFKQYRYSIRFFDLKGCSVADIPHLKLPEVIIDKRNFGRSGNYKFVLRRDGILLESGYVKVAM